MSGQLTKDRIRRDVLIEQQLAKLQTIHRSEFSQHRKLYIYILRCDFVDYFFFFREIYIHEFIRRAKIVNRITFERLKGKSVGQVRYIYIYLSHVITRLLILLSSRAICF